MPPNGSKIRRGEAPQVGVACENPLLDRKQPTSLSEYDTFASSSIDRVLSDACFRQPAPKSLLRRLSGVSAHIASCVCVIPAHRVFQFAFVQRHSEPSYRAWRRIWGGAFGVNPSFWGSSVCRFW